LLAVLKAAYEHGKELREGFIKQVLVKPTQVTPDPGEHHRIGEGIAGSAIQTNRPIGAAYDVHHITIGRKTLRPSALFAVGEPHPLLLYESEQIEWG
jgi:hypothetical protein